MINDERLPRDLFVLGASAGGVTALTELVTHLPEELPATLGIVLHRSPTFETMLDEILARRTALPVTEPADGDPIGPGRIYLAPRDFHLLVWGDRWQLSRGPRVHFARPAVDPLFASAAASQGKRVVGILLSGGGADGVSGLIAIKAAGGITVAQDPSEALSPSMPAHAISEDSPDAVMRLSEIAALIPALASGEAFPASCALSP